MRIRVGDNLIQRPVSYPYQGQPVTAVSCKLFFGNAHDIGHQ